MSHDVPTHVARLRALEAAEKRRRVGAVLGGPRRLGGAVPTRNLSPRELAAAVRLIRPCRNMKLIRIVAITRRPSDVLGTSCHVRLARRPSARQRRLPQRVRGAR